MAYELRLDDGIRRAGWKVKIRDRERLEPPHVTILCKRRAWRLCLRTKVFLDQGDSWRQIDDEVRRVIEEQWHSLCEAWDELYPENPVPSVTDERKEQE